MPTIPYPNVPDVPGVPNVPRLSGSTTTSATLSTGMSSPGIIPSTWGIFESGSNGQTPFYDENESGGTVSFFSFGVDGATQVADFPIEAPTSTGSGAQFASFNKVYVPTTPVVRLSFEGTNEQKVTFLSTVEQATNNAILFDIYTPGTTYTGYTIERYSYRRTAKSGASLLTVEMCFKQIKQVTPTYSNTTILAPQSPSASPSSNTGNAQTSAPSSILANVFGKKSGTTLGVGGQQ